MSEVEKDTIEVSEDFVKAVAEEIKPSIVDSVKEAMTLATEKTVKKDLTETKDLEEVNKKEVMESDPIAKESKEMRFIKASVALVNGDMQTVRSYNKYAMDMRTKAGYGNIGTNADGAFLVPDPDFDMAVERLEEEYGISFQYADVRRINSNSVKLNKKSAGFEFTETAEAANITGVKLSIGQVTADLRKFAAIAPATNELTADSAVDYWSETTKEFARARAKKADELVFTDATSGILEEAGTAAQTIGAAITDLDWDDILNAEVKVPTPSAKNGKLYMHRTTWNQLVQKKDAESRYLFSPNPNELTTPWGTPVILTEILPASSAVSTNTAFAIFGDLSHAKLYVKNGLELTVLREGVVKDADGTDFNLALQDGQALRGVTRMLSVVKFPEAFCLIGTGTVS